MIIQNNSIKNISYCHKNKDFSQTPKMPFNMPSEIQTESHDYFETWELSLLQKEKDRKLHWCHMSVMVSQATDILTICWTAHSALVYKMLQICYNGTNRSWFWPNFHCCNSWRLPSRLLPTDTELLNSSRDDTTVRDDFPFPSRDTKWFIGPWMKMTATLHRNFILFRHFHSWKYPCI